MFKSKSVMNSDLQIRVRALTQYCKLNDVATYIIYLFLFLFTNIVLFKHIKFILLSIYAKKYLAFVF